MRYGITVSAIGSALCFVFSASQDGAIMTMVLAVAGAMLGAHALSTEDKMVKRLERLAEIEKQ